MRREEGWRAKRDEAARSRLIPAESLRVESIAIYKSKAWVVEIAVSCSMGKGDLYLSYT